MTNVLLLLLLGGVLGWAITASKRDFQAADALANILTGSIISFTVALIATGGTLLGGIAAMAYGDALASALLRLCLWRLAHPSTQ